MWICRFPIIWLTQYVPVDGYFLVIQYLFKVYINAVLKLQIKAYTEGSNTPIEIYYGVPYATPPKGRYRFSVRMNMYIYAYTCNRSRRDTS